MLILMPILMPILMLIMYAREKAARNGEVNHNRLLPSPEEKAGIALYYGTEEAAPLVFFCEFWDNKLCA